MRLGSVVLAGLLWMAVSLPDSAWAQEYGVAAPSATERPSRGMSMSAVESRFGAPTRRVAPVGTPPITRWEYPGFVVYFEYDHVVHSVVGKEE